jgi:pyroglutamyl-peptidase
LPQQPQLPVAARAPKSQQDEGVLLLTCFEPFGGEGINSSQVVAQALHGQVIGGLTVVAVVLPCVFATAPVVLRQALEQWRPRLVLAFGQAAGRFELSLERVAINLVDAPLADNAGQQPSDAPVVGGGPPAHFTTLPVKAMVNAMRNAGLPAGLSNSAGTFVCNQVFYHLQQQLVNAQPPVPSGFMHLPLLPEQAALQSGEVGCTLQLPSLALHDMVQGVRVALMVAWESFSGAGVPKGQAASNR